jgi:predicted phosphodiesterase
MRIGIITDIHENVEMLQESIRLAAVHKCDELVCLGDITGFDQRFYRYSNTRSAKACVELIRSNCRWIAAGNHDLHAAGTFPSYSNGFAYPEDWFKMNIEGRKTVSRGRVWCYEGDSPNDLDEDELVFIRKLPEQILVNVNDITCLFSHYIFPDLTGSTTRYVKRNTHLKEHWEFMNHFKVKYSFCGHFHNFFAGFAYKTINPFSKAIHSIPHNSFNLGDERVIIVIPPLAGERGRASFSMIDMKSLKFNIIAVG